MDTLNRALIASAIRLDDIPPPTPRYVSDSEEEEYKPYVPPPPVKHVETEEDKKALEAMRAYKPTKEELIQEKIDNTTILLDEAAYAKIVQRVVYEYLKSPGWVKGITNKVVETIKADKSYLLLTHKIVRNYLDELPSRIKWKRSGRITVIQGDD